MRVMDDYHVVEDAELIRELLGLTADQFEKAAGVTRMALYRWASGESVPNEESLATLYDFAYSKGIRLNKIKAQLYCEEYDAQGHVALFHGPKNGLIGKPSLKYGRDNCDFGRGFYYGTRLEQSAMFVSEFEGASLYMCDFNPAGLNIAEFKVERDWMLAVSLFRGKLADYSGHAIVESLRSRIEQADCVIAPIADNRMFEIIDSFAEGEMTDAQCRHCLSATDLGSQYVIKTDKALRALEVVEHCYLSSQEKRDYLTEKSNVSRTGRDKVKAARRQYRNEGMYIEELLG